MHHPLLLLQSRQTLASHISFDTSFFKKEFPHHTSPTLAAPPTAGAIIGCWGRKARSCTQASPEALQLWAAFYYRWKASFQANFWHVHVCGTERERGLNGSREGQKGHKKWLGKIV
eukprot:scaffold182807_cov31-Tisochrysis_lutea.AAC.2